jgi:hypothetical protein
MKPEAFVVSYPKSGRTWLRVLLGKYVCLVHNLPDSDMLDSMRVTYIGGMQKTRFTHDDAALTNMRPWQELSGDKACFFNKTVVLLRRDLRDTLVSAYFQAVKRKGFYKGTISEFIRDDRFGAKKVVAFHALWDAARDVPRKILDLTYGDLHDSAAHVLHRLLVFLGSPTLDEYAIQESARFCEFKTLRNAAAQPGASQRFGSSVLSPPKNPEDTDSYKLRRGEAGAYRDYLSAEDIEYIGEIEKGGWQ